MPRACSSGQRRVEAQVDDVLMDRQLSTGSPERAFVRLILLVILPRVPSMSPSYAEGFFWYADALIHNGHPAEGLPLVERSLELTPDFRVVGMY
ncbi:MAG: hypothetical protein ACI9BW_002815 [Gammaproteobacteria bacterium]|jgi:hypothetical protein